MLIVRTRNLLFSYHKISSLEFLLLLLSLRAFRFSIYIRNQTLSSVPQWSKRLSGSKFKSLCSCLWKSLHDVNPEIWGGRNLPLRRLCPYTTFLFLHLILFLTPVSYFQAADHSGKIPSHVSFIIISNMKHSIDSHWSNLFVELIIEESLSLKASLFMLSLSSWIRT